MLDKLLHAHPREIGESYTEHAGHALWIGIRLVFAGLACLVHALLPGLFQRTATRTLTDIHSRMQQRSEGAAGSAEVRTPRSPPANRAEHPLPQ